MHIATIGNSVFPQVSPPIHAEENTGYQTSFLRLYKAGITPLEGYASETDFDT